MRHASTPFIAAAACTAILAGALAPIEPAEAQSDSIRQVAIIQCAVVTEPPDTSPEIRVVAFSRSSDTSDVPAVPLGRECARGLLDVLSKRFVIDSTLGDQSAGTVLYTLIRSRRRD